MSLALVQFLNATNRNMPLLVRASSIGSDDVCTEVNNRPRRQRCSFVRNNPDCNNNIFIINYLTMYYCNADTSNKFTLFWIMLCIGFLCGYMFWMMRLATNEYFCPTLKTISDSLNLNENAAGVTLLSIANGSPDIFTSIAGMMTKNKYAYLSCVAQVMFSHLFVGGLVIVTRPFYLEATYYLRDYGFLFLNLVLLDYLQKRQPVMTRSAALAGACMWPIHTVVAVIDQRLLLLRVKQLEAGLRKQEQAAAQARLDAADAAGEPVNEEQLEKKNVELIQMQSMAVLPVRRKQMNEEKIRYSSANARLFRQFFETLNKFNKKQFKRGNRFVRLHMLLKLPLEVALRFMVPVVNMELPNYGWSKLLCCIQLVLAPTYIIFLSCREISILGVDSFKMSIYVLLPATCFVFWRTRTDTRPKYFRHMAFLGFVGSILVIYGISSEIQAMFFSMGTILNASHPLILATVVCWSLNCNDLIACIALARQGLPRMAYAGCFASPVFASFVGVTLPLIFESLLAANGVAIPFEGGFGETSNILAIIGLLSTLMISLSTNFMMRRACGMLHLAFYLFYLVMLLLMEHKVIHAHGVDLL